MSLRCVGLCGVDESVDPSLLSALGSRWSRVEFGVLFRPGREGTNRYPRWEWVQRLSKEVQLQRLCAHLCGSAVDGVLRGDASFVIQKLRPLGFRRCQLNATRANGRTANLDRSKVFAACRQVPDMEFILQANAETRVLWKHHDDDDFPANVSLLFDASCGTGLALDLDSIDLRTYFDDESDEEEESLSEEKKTKKKRRRPPRVGFAGGIGKANVGEVLGELRGKIRKGDSSIWIDMESSLRRSADDRFDVNEAWAVCLAVDKAGWDAPVVVMSTEKKKKKKLLPFNARVSDHPVLAHKLALMRDRRTKPREFRNLLKETTFYLGYEATSALPRRKRHDVVAPNDGEASQLNCTIALIPVMRAGLGMIEPMLEMLPNAVVHQIGMFKRGDPNDRPIEYYSRLPKDCRCDVAIILDPVVLTARTVHAVVIKLKKWGAKKIIVLAVLASKQGLETLFFGSSRSRRPRRRRRRRLF